MITNPPSAINTQPSTASPPSFPSLPSVQSLESELTRLKTLIAEAQHHLQYARASNCPDFFVNLALEKLNEATR